MRPPCFLRFWPYVFLFAILDFLIMTDVPTRAQVLVTTHNLAYPLIDFAIRGGCNLDCREQIEVVRLVVNVVQQ